MLSEPPFVLVWRRSGNLYYRLLYSPIIHGIVAPPLSSLPFIISPGSDEESKVERSSVCQ